MTEPPPARSATAAFGFLALRGRRKANPVSSAGADHLAGRQGWARQAGGQGGVPMYKDYFHLAELPFSIAPDPRFLFMSARHPEALAHLMYGLAGEGGFVLLTGEVGTGKTTVCRCLLEQIPDNCDVAFIMNPRVSAAEMLATVCDEFHLAYPEGATRIKVFTDLLYGFLLRANAAGRRAVLIVDEAQNLDPEVLEQLRLLTNLETNPRKPIRPDPPDHRRHCPAHQRGVRPGTSGRLRGEPPASHRRNSQEGRCRGAGQIPGGPAPVRGRCCRSRPGGGRRRLPRPNLAAGPGRCRAGLDGRSFAVLAGGRFRFSRGPDQARGVRRRQPGRGGDARRAFRGGGASKTGEHRVDRRPEISGRSRVAGRPSPGTSRSWRLSGPVRALRSRLQTPRRPDGLPLRGALRPALPGGPGRSGGPAPLQPAGDPCLAWQAPVLSGGADPSGRGGGNLPGRRGRAPGGRGAAARPVDRRLHLAVATAPRLPGPPRTRPARRRSGLAAGCPGHRPGARPGARGGRQLRRRPRCPGEDLPGSGRPHARRPGRPPDPDPPQPGSRPAACPAGRGGVREGRHLMSYILDALKRSEEHT